MKHSPDYHNSHLEFFRGHVSPRTNAYLMDENVESPSLAEVTKRRFNLTMERASRIPNLSKGDGYLRDRQILATAGKRRLIVVTRNRDDFLELQSVVKNAGVCVLTREYRVDEARQFASKINGLAKVLRRDGTAPVGIPHRGARECFDTLPNNDHVIEEVLSKIDPVLDQVQPALQKRFHAVKDRLWQRFNVEVQQHLDAEIQRTAAILKRQLMQIVFTTLRESIYED